MNIQNSSAIRKTRVLMRRFFSKVGLHRPAHLITANDFWCYGEPEIQLLPWLVDANKTAIDVGAANGLYSHYLLGFAKSVVAFEPNPESFSMLRKVIPSLDVRQIALSNKVGNITLKVPVSGKVVASGWGTIHRDNDFSEISPESIKNYTVEMASLDSFEITDIGFIKIDVEGHENEVIEGAINTLKACKPNLLIEVSGNNRGNTSTKTCKLLQEIGYATFYLKNGKLLQQIDKVPNGITALNIIALP